MYFCHFEKHRLYLENVNYIWKISKILSDDTLVITLINYTNYYSTHRIIHVAIEYIQSQLNEKNALNILHTIQVH